MDNLSYRSYLGKDDEIYLVPDEPHIPNLGKLLQNNLTNDEYHSIDKKLESNMPLMIKHNNQEYEALFQKKIRITNKGTFAIPKIKYVPKRGEYNYNTRTFEQDTENPVRDIGKYGIDHDYFNKNIRWKIIL